jgi:hypothetical protein
MIEIAHALSPIGAGSTFEWKMNFMGTHRVQLEVKGLCKDFWRSSSSSSKRIAESPAGGYAGCPSQNETREKE